MMVFMISAGLGVLALLFRLAAVFRLTIPLLYVVVMNTVCHSWYQAHSLWGDRLFFYPARPGRSVLAAFFGGAGLELHSGEAGGPRRCRIFQISRPSGKRER